MAVRKFQAALSPAIVATITTAEQSFAVGPGDLNLGATVVVTTPRLNAGVGIANARVVSLTNIGITFVNPTAAGVTPTAGEVYQFVVID